jgi:2-oxo-4-hydroxy-4-carboxy-5-ureidoimidazoline decarboxylase
VDLAEFNTAPATALTDTLLACCEAPPWAAAVRDARPYAHVDGVLAEADRAARRLNPADVERAIAAHPRIGERAEGAGTSAGWSRAEQSGVGRDATLQADLVEGNRAYEKRFGRVFLICASGLSGAQVLSSLRQRLGNDDDTERVVVAGELRKIALLRLRRVFQEGEGAS